MASSFCALGRPSRSCYQYGTRAVEIFWCVSGFIFFHQYGAIIASRGVTAGRFFWLRFSRLYPLHLLTLLAVAGLQLAYHSIHGSYFVVAINDLKHFGLNLLFASHWGLQNGFSFNAPVWSVSVEILVYAFFFAATWLLRVDFFITIVWLLACAGLNHLLGYEGVFVRCLFYFYAGGLSCLSYQWLAGQSRSRRIAAGAAATASLLWCLRRFQVTDNLDLWVLNLGTPLALLAAALASPLVKGRGAQLADYLGNLTYASYLGHFPLQLAAMLLLGLLGAPRDLALSPWFLLVYLAVVLGASRAIYLWIELPAQAHLRRRFAPVATK
jgi:peptidoglycan/LPS O-acetylase OafA/YrhL